MVTLSDIVVKRSIKKLKARLDRDDLKFLDEERGKVYALIGMETPDLNDPSSWRIHVQYFDHMGKLEGRTCIDYSCHSQDKLTPSRTLLTSPVSEVERIALLLKHGFRECLHYPGAAKVAEDLMDYKFDGPQPDCRQA